MLSFTAVVFAQARIAAINTLLTAVCLLGLLPLLGMPLPLAGRLVAATFVASLLPVVGNLVSNAMIVVISLTQSVALAGLSLVWLVLIHKLEYVLHARIIGRRIGAQAWELLLAMLTLEALFGLAGLVSAPVLYAQLKRVLQERGLF